MSKPGGSVITQNLITTLLLIIMGSLTQALPAEPLLHVSNTDIGADYPLTGNNSATLTDGNIEKHPMWLYRGAIGWKDHATVSFQVDISREATTGILKLHTACGSGAGVSFPQRIDVYSIVPGGWRHLNKSEINTEANCNRAQWIEIPIVNAAKKLLLVVQGNGRFIFFDEMQLANDAGHISAPVAPTINMTRVSSGTQSGTTKLEGPNKDNQPASQPSELADVTAAVSDSRHRLQMAQQLNANQKLQAQVSHIPTSNQTLVIWQQDPWLPVEKWFESMAANLPMPTIELNGTNRETQTFCIGLLANSADTTTLLQISPTNITAEQNIKIRQLMPVLAANGARVYDRLAPLDDGKIQPLPGEPVYLWVDVNLATFPAHQQFNLKIVDSKTLQQQATIPVSVDVVTDNNSAASLQVVNWAYPDAGPIWRNRALASAELFSSGTNVFVIAPSVIPGASLDGAWDQRQHTEFDSQVRMFSPHGQLLLFMGWDENKNPFIVSPGKPKDMNAAKLAFKQWLTRITKHLETLGISRQNWALYPVDEPHDEQLDLLQSILNVVREHDPTIRTYANPIVADSILGQTTKIIEMQKQITLWQPNLQLMSDAEGVLFRQLGRPWWLYAVPPEPAKLASPVQFYRTLPWQAWRFGATGIGFWSYSDTGNSTARDDLDGRRPDYAVVYEGGDGNGVESSRRWEAFKQGIQDYHLLAAAGIDRASILSPEQYDTNKIEVARKQALLRLRNLSTQQTQ